MIWPRNTGRVLDQEERLFGFALTNDALLILGLSVALQPKVAPAAEDQRSQSGDGDQGHYDRHNAGGGAVVHYRHFLCKGEFSLTQALRFLRLVQVQCDLPGL